MISRIAIFLIINFSALALGTIFTGKGVPSDWYYNLNKAPWTPPGWVFGAAWTSIMICYAVYMAILWEKTDNKSVLITTFSLQFVLNVLWNPIFFQLHWTVLGLIVLILLTALIWWFVLNFASTLKYSGALLLPYGIWLLIAASLNAWIVFKN
jgi:tryptophan-rich sensory protein